MRSEQINGHRFVELIRRIIRSPIHEAEQLHRNRRGIAQGSPLSPVLLNLVLNPLDEATTAELPHGEEPYSVSYYRYADDILLTVKGSETIQQIVRIWLEGKLTAIGLQLNPEKTQITPMTGGFEWLGLRFEIHNRNLAVLITQKSIDRLIAEAEQTLTDSASDTQAGRKMLNKVIGWSGQYGKGDTVWPTANIMLVGPVIRERLENAVTSRRPDLYGWISRALKEILP